MKKVFVIIALVAALQLAVVSATYAAPPAWGGGGSYHHVMYGETLYSIGRMYNADPYCIAEYNGIWDKDLIFAGEVLYIPASCASYPWHGQKPVHYPGKDCCDYGHGGKWDKDCCDYGHGGKWDKDCCDYGHGGKWDNDCCDYGYEKPVHLPSFPGKWDKDCCDYGHGKPVHYPSPHKGGSYGYGYGYGYSYDYTGYYYGHGKDRYSPTCGYSNNCW